MKFNKKSAKKVNKNNIREHNLSEEEDHDDEIITQNERNDKIELQTESKNKNSELNKSEEIRADSSESKSSELESNSKSNEVQNQSEIDEKLVKKPKLDRAELIRQMFTKRTKGKVFEEAQKRYFQRKSLHNLP